MLLIKAIWGLIKSIFAKPSSTKDPDHCMENEPIKHYYPIPKNLANYSKSEFEAYANNLLEFILRKNGISKE
jgi:hypothetical protein